MLFLTESFWPVLGGGETHIRDLARRLVSAGFGASGGTRRPDAAWPAVEDMDGVAVRRVGPAGPGRGGKYRMVPRALAALRTAARRCDVLVVRGTRVLGLPGLVAGAWANRPVVLQPEVNGELTGEVYTWGTALDRPLPRALLSGAVRARNRLLRDASAGVAMSALIAREFVAAGFPADRVRHIPHGVDTARFRPRGADEKGALRARLGLPADATIVTYTGRLLRGKGLETLVDAFARVPDAHLLIVGSGAGQALSVEDALRARVAAAGLASRVTFAGRVEAVEDWLGASDLFAFPSEFEALGLSLIEAAACGLACVGSRTGGIVDVIDDGRSGLLVPPGDVAALAAALGALVADPVRRAVFGAAGRAVVEERFDALRSFDRYRALFADLAERRG
ncbi:MAG: glycosyltransferase family 4 protein [Vicinamibacteria bacterium]